MYRQQIALHNHSQMQPGIQQNVLLAPYTSWQIGGPAEYFAKPKTLAELIEIQSWAQQKKLPLQILGGGSNVLISDQGVKGLVVCLKDFTGATVYSETRDQDQQKEYLCIEALAGTSKSELLKIFIKEKLAPALFLAGLPGDLGGGIVMNAGVSEAISPREFTEIVDWIEVLKPHGQIKRLPHAELNWSYRHLSGWEPGIVVKAKLYWPKQQDPTILEKVRTANQNRLTKQPLDMPSCGSVFINPPGDKKAAQLIDACGLKGYKVGGAQVSVKHANFIVNTDHATAHDVISIIEHIQKTVYNSTGVNLKTEVIRMGIFS